MVESEAQGRLPGINPISVVDIGSNSVRLVIYEGLNRAPTVLFNEKVLCGLGKGLAATGRMDETAIDRALAALKRFRALSEQARAFEMHVLATAAAREAENGAAFIDNAESILGRPVKVLTGEEEARYSAMGIIAGYFEPDGVAGDLGGGSLELVDVRGSSYSGGQTLPLGGLRLAELSDNSISKARTIARQHLRKAAVLKGAEGRTFYAVGGTWRNIAKLHMDQRGYPLHMMQAYEIDAPEALEFLASVAAMKQSKIDGIKVISRNRRTLLPYGAVALQEVLTTMGAARVSFSALGVREGYLYSLLGRAEAGRDPLLTAAGELAILRARSPEHARELASWTGKMFPVFGVSESVEEARYRQAACLLADISWRAHPDYRGLQALNIIAHSTFTGISHAGRAYIALTSYYRFEGLNDDGVSSRLAAIAGPKYLEHAKLLGGMLRVVYLFSASMPGMIPRLAFEPAQPSDGDVEIVLVAPRDCEALLGERLEGRLQQLSKLTGKKLGFRLA
ncbi:exopolyphosphatase [Hoeflea phototrophica DFL-43]|uniref:exopolyphosphatase n=1 Tax=Hoeflea phototrophica (strain DSM 17068 / NCIMB 14078 / DFL-43) TaxID=411684 RepID=A9D4E2_HOEPD|nr:exopolyphosphatase [Hoeflea phototrophica]EDQ33865.1 exopolyphosphatase [Hoeflea phototrophica DFL-43]